MTSTTPVPSTVKSRPMFRRGQSVRCLSRDLVGVVVHIRGVVHELAVWPSARIEVDPSDLVHLTPLDACARSCASESDANVVRATSLNRCMPRARDGRCHWCDRELACSEEVDLG